MFARSPAIGAPIRRRRSSPRRSTSPALQAVLTALRLLKDGLLIMHLPDGRVLQFGDGNGPTATILIKDIAFADRVFVNGDIGFAEGWIEHLWDTPDLFELLTLLSGNGDRIARFIKGNTLGKLLGWVAHLGNPNTRAGSRRNIVAHYDLGNAFYAEWLDPSMTYSAALYANGAETLEAAQLEKYRALARAAGIQPGEQVLEIGCGWGGFAEVAAREFGARVTGLTISDAQHDYAEARMQRAGLSDQVEIRKQDYRDVTGRYDRIVSIEMLEAVGEAFWPAYFAKIAEVLRPGGRAALQVITVRDDLFESYRRRIDFIQRCVFPGGMLPSDAALKEQTARVGLTWIGAEHAGSDYVRTLRAWADAFAAHTGALQAQGFDDEFRRFWHFYLAYCAAGFASHRTDVSRITLQA